VTQAVEANFAADSRTTPQGLRQRSDEIAAPSLLWPPVSSALHQLLGHSLVSLDTGDHALERLERGFGQASAREPRGHEGVPSPTS